MVKNALFVTVAIMIFTLCAGIFGLLTPSIKYTEEKVAVYNHQGFFTHIAYSAAQEDKPPAVLFPQIVNGLDILFAHTGFATEQVTVKVFLMDKSGSWQKEIPVKATGANPLSFPLDLSQLLTLGNTINSELGIRGNGYLIKIVAQVGPDFSITLDGNLDTNILTWDESGFYRVEYGFPGNETLRGAAFGYRAKLKDNSLFGSVSIERTPDIPALSKIDPGVSLTTSFVQSCDIGFNYQLISNNKISSLSQEVKVNMTMSETGGWTKTFELVLPKKVDNAVNFVVPLDIKRLVEIADSNDQSVGSKSSVDRNITIIAQVHTVARMESGIVDETFTQQLNGTIGRLITWQDTDKTGASQLKLIKNGEIKRTVAIPNTAIQNLRLISSIILGLCAVLFIFLLRLYLSRRMRPTLQDSLKASRKKYGELVSEISDFSTLKEGDSLIPVFTLEALAKIANNSLKPVLLHIAPDKLTYRVIDNTITYEYIDQFESLKEERS